MSRISALRVGDGGKMERVSRRLSLQTLGMEVLCRAGTKCPSRLERVMLFETAGYTVHRKRSETQLTKDERMLPVGVKAKL